MVSGPGKVAIIKLIIIPFITFLILPSPSPEELAGIGRAMRNAPVPYAGRKPAFSTVENPGRNGNDSFTAGTTALKITTFIM